MDTLRLEALFFWIFAARGDLCGLLTVMARNAVYSALFLIVTLVSVAALFVLAALSSSRVCRFWSTSAA